MANYRMITGLTLGALSAAWLAYDGIKGVGIHGGRFLWGGHSFVAEPEPTKTYGYKMPSGRDYSLTVPANAETMLDNFLNEHVGKDMTGAIKQMDALDGHKDGKATSENIEKVISEVELPKTKKSKTSP